MVNQLASLFRPTEIFEQYNGTTQIDRAYVFGILEGRCIDCICYFVWVIGKRIVVFRPCDVKQCIGLARFQSRVQWFCIASDSIRIKKAVPYSTEQGFIKVVKLQ